MSKILEKLQTLHASSKVGDVTAAKLSSVSITWKGTKGKNVQAYLGKKALPYSVGLAKGGVHLDSPEGVKNYKLPFEKVITIAEKMILKSEWAAPSPKEVAKAPTDAKKATSAQLLKAFNAGEKVKATPENLETLLKALKRVKSAKA